MKMKYLDRMTEAQIKELLPAIGDRIRFREGIEVNLLHFRMLICAKNKLTNCPLQFEETSWSKKDEKLSTMFGDGELAWIIIYRMELQHCTYTVPTHNFLNVKIRNQ